MKKQLVSTGIILALLTSNIVIGYQYKKDTNEYEEKLTHQKQISDYRQKLIKDKSFKIDVLQKQVKSQENEISKLRNEIKVYKDKKESPSVNVSRGSKKNYTIQTFIVTSYTAGYESTGKYPSHPTYGITASGEKVKEGKTVACPPELEFGTKLKIPEISSNVYECTDRGGAIKGRRLDIYMESLSEAIEFGKKELKVVIFKS